MRKALFAALLFVLVVTVGCSTSSIGAVSAPASGSSPASAANAASPAPVSLANPTSAPAALPATVAPVIAASTATRVVLVPSATPAVSAAASATPAVIAADTTADPPSTPAKDDPVATPAAAKAAITTPVFVFFYADWCNVCSAMRPSVDQLKVQYGDRIHFAYINVDEPEGKKAAATYRVWAIPFFVLVKPTGEIVGQWVGQQADAVFPTAFDELLKSAGS